MIVTGGINSILLYRQHGFKLPIIQGKESTGANSIAVNPDKKSKIQAVVVGGDFNNKENSNSNCALIPNTFLKKPQPNIIEHPVQSPKGYKSCVTYIDGKRLVATGTSGTDISVYEGYHWTHISDQPFHVVQKAKNGNLILLAGPNGTIAKLEL